MSQFALRDAIKRGFLLPRIDELGARIYSQFLKWVLRGRINFLDAPESCNWIITIVNLQTAPIKTAVISDPEGSRSQGKINLPTRAPAASIDSKRRSGKVLPSRFRTRPA